MTNGKKLHLTLRPLRQSIPMAHISENGSEKKMAEGGNDAELLKEKANKYFKGNF